MDEKTKKKRLEALRFFAVAITVLNVLGHTVLGFEQSHLQSVAAVLAAYATEIILEIMKVRGTGETPRFFATTRREQTDSQDRDSQKRIDWQRRIDFFLPPHISGLAVAMLTYANDRIDVVIFAAVVAIASKALLQAPMDATGRMQHFMNPSNCGITVTLLCFHWVGVAMPYQFTENLPGLLGYLIPTIIIFFGSRINKNKTERLPLILAWLGGFVLQAVVRSAMMDVRLAAALNTMTGVAFILFTFYMITDPQTTPDDRQGQIWFGLGTAAVYGVLMALGVVYTLFFCLSITCLLRGGWLWYCHRKSINASAAPEPRVRAILGRA